MVSAAVVAELQTLGPFNPRATIVFLHGGPGMSCGYLRPYLDRLSDEFRLVFYRQVRKQGVQAMVDELRALILGQTGPVFILGHSWGSALALEYYKQHRADPRIAGIILAAAMIDMSFEEIAEQMRPAPDSWTDPVALAKFKPDTIRAVPRFFTPPFWMEGARVWEQIDLCVDTLAQVFADYIGSLDHQPTLRSLGIPLLNIYGELDLRIPAEHSKKAAGLNPHVENVSIPGTGHLMFLEDPTAVTDSIRGFLGRTLSPDFERPKRSKHR